MGRQPSRVQFGQVGGVNPAGYRRPKPKPILLSRPPAQALEHTDRQGQRVQAATSATTLQAGSNPMANGTLLEGVPIASGGWRAIPHGLGRAFLGAMLVNPSALSTYAVSGNAAQGGAAALDKAQVLVEVSANLTCDLWVW